jgi:hypothetical protein
VKPIADQSSGFDVRRGALHHDGLQHNGRIGSRPHRHQRARKRYSYCLDKRFGVDALKRWTDIDVWIGSRHFVGKVDISNDRIKQTWFLCERTLAPSLQRAAVDI